MTTVLIADDNPQLLNILKNAAQKEGYEPILAEDGQSALDIFLRAAPADGFAGCDDAQAGRLSGLPGDPQGV